MPRDDFETLKLAGCLWLLFYALLALLFIALMLSLNAYAGYMYISDPSRLERIEAGSCVSVMSAPFRVDCHRDPHTL